MLLDHYKRLLAYNEWANARFLNVLTAADSVPDEVMVLINHIIGAECVWLSRLDERFPDDWGVWPNNPLAACREQAQRSIKHWKAFLDDESDDMLQRVIAYTNQKGDPFETRLNDILTHVFNHGTYHRGQIATRLRQAGITPPSSDFILFVRDRH